jgi:type I restriction enzyme R subunit
LNAEERRAVAERLSEEELAVYDLLAKIGVKLTMRQEQEVKKIAKELLERLKREKLVLDWRKKQQARAAVRQCIEQILDHLPPTFSGKVYEQACEQAYLHVYDSYFGEGKSIYSVLPPRPSYAT